MIIVAINWEEDQIILVERDVPPDRTDEIITELTNTNSGYDSDLRKIAEESEASRPKVAKYAKLEDWEAAIKNHQEIISGRYRDIKRPKYYGYYFYVL